LQKFLKFVLASVLILPAAFGQLALTTAQIAKRVSPSVVVIQGKTASGDVLGSGFIVSKDGKIATNLHVIRELTTASVQMANGETFDSVSVLATDERRDLAIIKVAGFNLPVLELGNSDGLTVGEPLVIVGRPQGLEGTVTAGILSAVRDSGEGFTVLQTDAAVNPGNSGGPLVNGRGQVIGVVSFKFRSAENLNFAIPANYVLGLLNNLQEPLTLDQMQRLINATKSANGKGEGPSLKETLDWLKEKIPLSTVNYVENWEHEAIPAFSASINDYATVVSLDSCIVVLDKVSTMTILNRPQVAASLSTFRYTVPLGMLQDISVALVENTDYGQIHLIYVRGGRWAYRVYLKSKSRDITRELNNAENPYVPVKITTDSMFLKFNDELLANRVAEAFKHAAALCRKTEPF